MTGFLDILRQRLAAAFADALGEGHAPIDPQLRPSQHAKFGDYQANAAMSHAKRLQRNPRELAQAVVDRLDLTGIAEKIDIAGPGFINLRLDAGHLARHLDAALADDRLGLPQAAQPQRVVVDYSSPNVAKEMHVGHLRSTVIGDAIARLLAHLGHHVIRQNHLGDWGTQFGMLIEHLLERGHDLSTDASARDLTELYKQAKLRFDAEPDFADRARRRVVALQAGDQATLTVWRSLVDQSRRYFQAMYDQMGVLLREDDYRGESFYNDRLAGVVDRLAAQGQLRESDGAQVVFPPGFIDRDGNALPMIVRKSDGGYLYATTDLAAALFRVHELHAQRIIYVVGMPQRQHFDMVFAALRHLGWVGPEVSLEHAGFGSVLGADGKMFRTREGETIRLGQLIDEARDRAAQVIRAKASERGDALDERRLRETASVIGLGALKYADLANDRLKDYVFDWDRMLAFEGNTAPYIQYSYTRISSIFRRCAEQGVAWDPAAPLILEAQAERALALRLLQWPLAVESAGQSLEVHTLCACLHDLASTFHSFFESCPVLKAASPAQTQSRLRLCDGVARTLRSGLGLLGIDVVEQM